MAPLTRRVTRRAKASTTLVPLGVLFEDRGLVTAVLGAAPAGYPFAHGGGRWHATRGDFAAAAPAMLATELAPRGSALDELLEAGERLVPPARDVLEVAARVVQVRRV